MDIPLLFCVRKVWLQNIVKCGKYSHVKFVNFGYFCITPGKVIIMHAHSKSVITTFPVSVSYLKLTTITLRGLKKTKHVIS
jgi:hypothetical protein